MTQDMKKTMKMKGNIVKHLLLMAVMMVVGATGSWGQTTDYSGTYYIASDGNAAAINNKNVAESYTYSASTPATNYYIVPASNPQQSDKKDAYFDGTSEQKPFLTTYKTNKSAESLWELTQVTDNGAIYYHIKNVQTGKYVVYDPFWPDDNNLWRRKCMHLDGTSVPEGDAGKFVVGERDNAYYIQPKSLKNNIYTYWNIADKNRNAMYGLDSGNYYGGLIGLYQLSSNALDPNSRFMLEDKITRPIITYNDATDKITITAVQSGATLIYTTDGSTPTTSNGTAVNNTTITFNPSDGVTTIKAVAVVNGELSNVATFFTPVLFGSQHKYLIQSQNNAWNTTDFHFYMIPGDEDNSIIKVNTTSLFRPSMEWYFLNAGIEDGVQYFYAVNNANSKYMCYDGTNGVYMDTYSDNTKFKFKIVESSTAGSFNLIPYDLRAASGNTNRFLCKPNDGSVVCNANANAITLNNNSNAWTNWKFIVSSTLDKTAPFSATDAASISYYKIASVGSSGYYIVPPSGTATNVTTSNSSTENMKWYFEEAQAADASDWLTYYHIKNAVTGEYLYFTKDANDAGACLEMRSTIASGSEDRYMFTWARTATDGQYYIIPKILKDAEQNRISTLRRDNGTLKTILTRQAGNYAWTFEASSYKCETPVLTYDPLTGKISITCGTPGATIYVAHYDNEPTSSDVPELTAANVYSGEFDALPGYYKAVAARSTGGEDVSDAVISDEIEEFHCMRPVISITSNRVTITCATPGAAIYYIEGTGEFSENEVNYGGTLYDPETGFESSGIVIKAIAVKGGDWGTRSAVAIYDKIPRRITSLGDIDNMDGVYYIDGTFTASGTIGSATDPFTGELDGGLVEFSISQPLFGYINGATIKNVIISSASVSTNGHAGAIANVATGDSRIYNCGINSGSVSGSNYVGGLVGLLDESSRVINCYSYADITGGSYVGGIVGWNNVATTATNLKTMVMNCMFYGDITGGSNKAPIYNGEIITNDGDDNGVNNFNYYRQEASYVKEDIDVYNCALAAETRFLQRFEFFRHLLNSNRELAAWWATGSTANKDEMMKWVLEPSQIGTSTPYPILKTPGKYASVVNYTPDETAYDENNRNKGCRLTTIGSNGRLAVTISMGSGGEYFDAPSGAGLKSGESGMLDLTITDKDFEHFNFNYGKVQLPYYNDYCDGNYTGNRVVTGWKITSITGGTTGNYSTSDDVTYDADGNLTATPYNFADRKCTDKDLYSKSGRVFNQGAYWDVPDGVTAITIEPYWGKAVYLADAYWDVTYQDGTTDNKTDAMKTATNVTTVGGGQRYENRTSTFNGQTVYTSLGGDGNAISSSALYAGTNEATYSTRSVYDYAVVLVGNYHNLNDIAGGSKPYTITSVDLDGDNEPDYSFILRFNDRTGFHPVRYDFLNLIGLGMAQKTTGGTGSYNLGIMQPKYWFEVTNTALFRVTQFEYSKSDRVKNPYILQGGVIEQWVTQQGDAGDRVSYFHVGGNVWFKEFHRGSHQDNKDKSTPHPPVSVTGGDYDEFYLTGLYQSQATIYDDNAECYINGGRFGEMAGAGMEGIGTSDGKGNITWMIDHADIAHFYGGGINFDKPVHGNIHTIISNSYVDEFCGGPKFGDMESGRTVKTIADNCTFGVYFGAGYGGNSYNRYAPTNQTKIMNCEWNKWVTEQYKQTYSSEYKGVSTQIDYQFIPHSLNLNNVARLFVEFVGFSLATTRNVTSNLTGCTINGNFYGGGSLGKVSGDVTSTLTNCTVKGNVFGAGYSATLPTVEVMPMQFIEEPKYDTQSGSFLKAVLPSKETSPATVTYTWEHKDETIDNTDKAIDNANHILYTNEDLSHTNLGSVSGAVTLTLTTDGQNGKTIVGTNGDPATGHVYGGGDESYVNNTTTPANAYTTVTISGNTEVLGNVFGGGNRGAVSGSATVNIQD